MPGRLSRYTTGIEIRPLLARRTLHADGTKAACASHHEWLVGMPVVSLLGPIACRVAVHASGMLDYFAGLGEERDRALPFIRNGRKLACGLERAHSIGLCG